MQRRKMTYKITESDALTGITIERDATPDEIANLKFRQQKLATRQAEVEAKARAAVDRPELEERDARLQVDRDRDGGGLDAKARVWSPVDRIEARS